MDLELLVAGTATGSGRIAAVNVATSFRYFGSALTCPAGDGDGDGDGDGGDSSGGSWW